MIFIPSFLLERHVKQTCSDLANLMKNVDELETAVAEESQHAELNDLIFKTTSCNASLIKLERRWHFETNALAVVQDFINSYQNLFRYKSDKEFRVLVSKFAWLRRLNHTSQYDLGVLPRRIGNQFSAVSQLWPFLIHSS